MLLAFSQGRITKKQAATNLGLRDYAELLVVLADAGLPPPMPSQEEMVTQASTLADLIRRP